MREIVEITLDFETYYSKKEKYSLSAKGMTYEKYIRNPKFEIIGLAVKEFNRPSQWLAPHEIQDWLDYVAGAYGWENVRVIAHNGRFDMAILGWIYNVYPYQVADTMLMSRACQLWDGHSLDNVTKQLRDLYRWGVVKNERGETMWGIFDLKDLPDTLDKGEEVHNADGKHLMDFTDEEYDAYGDYAMDDVNLTYSAYQWFMTQRKFPEFEIDVMTYTIEMFTYPILEFDRKVLDIVSADVNGKRQALLDKVGATVDDLRSDIKFAEMLRELGVEPPTKINKKGEKKFAFAKGDLNFLALLDHDDEAVVDLVQARLVNKSSQAVTRVQSFIDLSERGKVPMPLEYAAAHTLRWGGSDALNVQNMNRNSLVVGSTPKGTFVFYNGKADRVVSVLENGNKVYLAKHGVVDNDEEKLHIFGLRDALKAPKGYQLCVQDLSQVELRMNSWLWGEQWILDALVSGKDIYKVTAASTYGIAYEDVTKSQRFVGKSQQLGLGYGAGVNGLKVVMGKRSEEFTDQELQTFVDSYRITAGRIKRGWDKCKSALGAMVSGVSVGLDEHGILHTQGHSIMTPGGMSLNYRNIHKRTGQNGYDEFVFWGKDKTTKNPAWERTFGGKIDENLCQHLCRNIMAEMMLNIRNDLRNKGWGREDAHLCLTVHDEVIVCCRDEIAEEVNEIMQYRMSQSPSWCSTLPLACDGDIAQRYGCAK